jgi:dihydrofolate reductase
MRISIIVAVAENNVIGKNNTLPWHLPADMKYFKDKTMGHCVVAGRKNFESIPAKYRPLPGRINLVVTRNEHYAYPQAEVVHSLEEAIKRAEELGETELFIIGGGEIFKQSLSIVDKIYLTRIHHAFDGDVFFPEIPEPEWKEISRKDCEADEKNLYRYSFIELVKA